MLFNQELRGSWFCEDTWSQQSFDAVPLNYIHNSPSQGHYSFFRYHGFCRCFFTLYNLSNASTIDLLGILESFTMPDICQLRCDYAQNTQVITVYHILGAVLNSFPHFFSGIHFLKHGKDWNNLSDLHVLRNSRAVPTRYCKYNWFILFC